MPDSEAEAKAGDSGRIVATGASPKSLADLKESDPSFRHRMPLFNMYRTQCCGAGIGTAAEQVSFVSKVGGLMG